MKKFCKGIIPILVILACVAFLSQSNTAQKESLYTRPPELVRYVDTIKYHEPAVSVKPNGTTR